MCGRYLIDGRPASATDWQKFVAQAFDAIESDVESGTMHERFNIGPMQSIALVEQVESDARRITEARWGWKPVWPKMLLINARDDKLGGKFWGSLMKPENRVLIPATGYYEWVRAEKKGERPAPFRHEVDGGELFAFAGLRKLHKDEDAEAPAPVAAIITTSPNETAARVHNRMPAILADTEAATAWLSPDVSPDEARGLIAPIEDSRLTVHPAGKAVNSIKNQGPEILDPETE